MFEFNVRAIAVIRTAQVASYVQPCPTIGLTVSGLKYVTTAEFEVQGDVPFLWFSPAGSPIEFEFGPTRENAAILLESEYVRASAEPGMVDIFDGHEWLPVSALSRLAPERLPSWRERLLEMHDAFRHPTAANRLRVELGVLDIIRHLLSCRDPAAPRSPAARLKALLDGDTWDRSLEQLSADVGASCDHLRLLFRQEYGLNPKEYRHRRRAAQAMELIVSTGLSAKEIAHALGFRQLSHFSAMLSQAFGTSPREAIRRFRHGRASDEAAPEQPRPAATPAEEGDAGAYLLTVCPNLPII